MLILESVGEIVGWMTAWAIGLILIFLFASLSVKKCRLIKKIKRGGEVY